MSARDKLVEQGIDALVRTGPRAIGSFVRAWLWIEGAIVLGISVLVFIGCLTSPQHAADPLWWELGISLFCGVFLALPCAVPVAIIIAIAHIAMRW